MDRESYSLVIRKKAHRYREFTPHEKKLLEESHRQAEPAPPPPSLEDTPGTRPATRGPAVPREVLHAELEAFQPFAYCQHHESFHLLESLAAVGAAPIEYPAAFALHSTLVTVSAAFTGIRDLLGLAPRKKEDEEDPVVPPERRPFHPRK
jgi:hypothetical protein